MKVEVDPTLKRTLDRLNKNESRKIEAKQRHLKKIDHFFDEKEKQIRKAGDQRVAQANLNSTKKLSESIIKGQEQITEHQSELKKTHKTLEREKANLITNSQDQLEALNDMYNTTYQSHLNRNQELSDNLEQRSHMITDELNHKLREEQMKMQHQTALKLDSSALTHQNRVKSQTDQFEKAIAQQKVEQQDQMAQNQLHHTKKMHSMSLKHMTSQVQHEKRLNQSIDKMKAHYKNLLQNTKESFDRKYKNMIATHQEMVGSLKEKMDSEIQGMVKSHISNKQIIGKKQSDKFYHISKLDPQVQDLGKVYEVKIPIAEHEKELIRLTGKDRNIKMALTRRFEDHAKLEDGTINKTKRSEVLYKDIPVPEIVNAKEITQSYKDGMLSFFIAKK